MIHKSPKFKVGHRVRITKQENLFSKGYIDNWSRQMFIIDSVMRTNLQTYEIKGSNEEDKIQSFFFKTLLLCRL